MFYYYFNIIIIQKKEKLLLFLIGQFIFVIAYSICYILLLALAPNVICTRILFFRATQFIQGNTSIFFITTYFNFENIFNIVF
jgi:hypothetical protein